LSSWEEAIACVLLLAIFSGQPFLFHISALNLLNTSLFVIIFSALE
jgi:hypothetical protein